MTTCGVTRPWEGCNRCALRCVGGRRCPKFTRHQLGIREQLAVLFFRGTVFHGSFDVVRDHGGGTLPLPKSTTTRSRARNPNTPMNLMELIRDVTEALEDADFWFEVLHAEESSSIDAIRWLKRFPIEPWGRIRWSAVPDAACQQWADQAELLALLRGLTHDLPRDPETEIFIVWSNAARPLVRAPFACLGDCGEAILDADFDVWILCPQYHWCIEKYHEGELCYGYLPDAR